MTTRASVPKPDIERALKAAVAAGLRVVSYEIAEGRVIVRTDVAQPAPVMLASDPSDLVDEGIDRAIKKARRRSAA